MDEQGSQPDPPATPSVAGVATFRVNVDAYDRLIGRYSPSLAREMANAAGIAAGQRALDIGCGPGALTAELASRLGADRVAAIDPSDTFVAASRLRNPGVEIHEAAAESLPFAEGAFDAVLAQLVLHFVTDPPAAAAEMRRALSPGGVACACVWDFTGGMRLLRAFWDAALAIDPEAPDEARTRRFGRDGEIAELFAAAGFRDVTSGTLHASASYTDFEDLWSGFLGGAGPSGAFCASLDDSRRMVLRRELSARLGDPVGSFELTARAWYATGRA